MEFSINQSRFKPMQCLMAASPDSNLPGSLSHLLLDGNENGHWSREDHHLLDEKIFTELELYVKPNTTPGLNMLIWYITDQSANKLKLVGSQEAEALISKYSDLEAKLHSSWGDRSFEMVA